VTNATPPITKATMMDWRYKYMLFFVDLIPLKKILRKDTSRETKRQTIASERRNEEV
jgi:hypothetical protein